MALITPWIVEKQYVLSNPHDATFGILRTITNDENGVREYVRIVCIYNIMIDVVLIYMDVCMNLFTNFVPILKK
jgi:hypothetical protein